jgi:hypothetical protein
LSNLWAQHPSEVVHGEREDANALTAPLKPSTTARFDAWPRMKT